MKICQINFVPSFNQAAFTLVELLVTLFITVAIVGIAGSILLSQQKSISENQSILEIRSPAYVALELLKQDILQAGFGVLNLDGDHPKNLAFYIQDGDIDRDTNGISELPDKLFLFDSSYIDYVELKNDLFASIGYTKIIVPALTSPHTPRASVTVKTLNLDEKENDTCYNNNTNCDELKGEIYQYIITDATNLSLGNSSAHGNWKVAKINSINNRTLDMDSDITGSRLGPAIYYCVDYDGNDTSCHPDSSDDDEFIKVLRRSSRTSGGRQPVIPGVIDMQIAYRDTEGWWYCCDTDDAFTGSDYDNKCDDSHRKLQSACKCQKIQSNKYVCPMNPFYPDEISTIQVTIITETQGSENLTPVKAHNGKAWQETDTYYSLYSIEVKPRNTINFKN